MMERPLLLAADAASRVAVHPWPDLIDRTAIVSFFLLAFGVPALGYWFMALDIRRYLRSLRRALVVIARVSTRWTPAWVRDERPPCLQALELELSCSEEQVVAAYRRRVKALHPDMGGNLRQFLQLQRHFEQALHLARSRAKAAG